MTSKPTLFQFWDRDPPAEIAAWMQTWSKLEPDFVISRYDDASALDLIVSLFGTEGALAYKRCVPPAMRSDLFRYSALYAFGGVYVDAGSEYFSGLARLYRNCERGLLLRRGPEQDMPLLINGFLIVKRPGDSLLHTVITEALNNIKNEKSQSVWDVTGPGILRRVYRANSHDLFRGFTIKELHSSEISRVFRFRRGPHKEEPTDWRRMRDGSASIFADASGGPISTGSPPDVDQHVSETSAHDTGQREGR